MEREIQGKKDRDRESEGKKERKNQREGRKRLFLLGNEKEQAWFCFVKQEQDTDEFGTLLI